MKEHAVLSTFRTSTNATVTSLPTQAALADRHRWSNPGRAGWQAKARPPPAALPLRTGEGLGKAPTLLRRQGRAGRGGAGPGPTGGLRGGTSPGVAAPQGRAEPVPVGPAPRAERDPLPALTQIL